MMVFSSRMPRSLGRVGQGLPMGGSPPGQLKYLDKAMMKKTVCTLMSQCSLLRVPVVVPDLIVNTVQETALQICPHAPT